MTTATQAPSDLARIVESSGLATGKAQALMEAFGPLVEEAGALCAQAEKIIVTDATQVTEIKQARAVRLALKAVRCTAETARKELKADALAQGRAIDAANKWLLERVEPAEARMQEAEDFAVRAEAARKAELRAARLAELGKFVADASIYPVEAMDPAAWAQLLDGSRLAHEARLAAAAKAEADRKAAEEARLAEEARMKAENERLRAEAAERERVALAEREAAAAEQRARDAAAQAYRDAIEAKARAEREATEAARRAEREASERAVREAEEGRAKAEREAQRVRDEAAAKAQAETDAAVRKAKAEAAAAHKAANAPDAHKLRAWAKAISAVPIPVPSQGENVARFRIAANMVQALTKGIEALAEQI